MNAIVLAGEGVTVRELLEERALALDTLGDSWRYTRVVAFRALVAAESDDESTMDAWAHKLLAAFKAVPHDEIATVTAMRRLAGLLDDRGRFGIARQIDSLLEARAMRYEMGFARTSDPDLKPR